MYVAKDDSAAAAFNQGRSMQGLQEVPLGQRATSTSGRDSVAAARYVAMRMLPVCYKDITRILHGGYDKGATSISVGHGSAWCEYSSNFQDHHSLTKGISAY